MSSQFVSYTSDDWSSAVRTLYLSLTAHFVDEQFTPQSLVVDVRPFGHPLDAERTALFFMEMIASVQVSQSVGFTVDNAATMDAALESVTLSEKDLGKIGCSRCAVLHSS
ncbi:hypothetical protein RCL1_003362 [Eukaryota sp. TZLM3-RCL]